jgi:hypothetical protein
MYSRRMEPRPRPSEITDALNRLIAQVGTVKVDRFVAEASRRTLAQMEWRDD